VTKRKDKAVQDNIPESWLCVDCGVNTHPGCPDGPQTRIDIALTGKSEVYFDPDSEVYAIKDDIWKAAGMRPWSGCLCVGCLEKRLGRQLRPKDFSRHDAKVWAQMPCTDRLLDRRGFRRIKAMTNDGERELIVDRKVADKIAATIAPGELPWLDDPEQ
jgi:hypothetical protein